MNDDRDQNYDTEEARERVVKRATRVWPGDWTLTPSSEGVYGFTLWRKSGVGSGLPQLAMTCLHPRALEMMDAGLRQLEGCQCGHLRADHRYGGSGSCTAACCRCSGFMWKAPPRNCQRCGGDGAGRDFCNPCVREMFQKERELLERG